MKLFRDVKFLPFLLLLFTSLPANAIDISRADVASFIDNMVSEHDYDRATLEAALENARTQESILEAISRPAEKSMEWDRYRKIFLTEKRITAGAVFWHEHAQELQRISDETGVSIEILVGIIGVETNYGGNTGSYRVLDALTTLGFDYPPRSKFFRRELEHFFLLVREEGMNATDATGSYAGAMGRPQFMPSSFREYAVDSTDDGKRDIWSNWEDVIGSVANYFVRHGWVENAAVVTQATLGEQWSGETPKNTIRPKETIASLSAQGILFATDLPGDQKAHLQTLLGADGKEYWVSFHNFFVITRYNTSVMYALAVHQLGQEIALEVSGGET